MYSQFHPSPFQRSNLGMDSLVPFSRYYMGSQENSNSMSHQAKKKKTEDDPATPDAAQKPLQLGRRRVWRACESCRRKKIKCDGNEPTCSQCTASRTQCTWLQTKDRAALSRHYVQELEARLLHMESLFSQIAPVLDQLGPAAKNLNKPGTPSTPGPVVASAPSPPSISQSSPPSRSRESPASTYGLPATVVSTPIKLEDDEIETSGQLALDEHGHMRWIGRSSTMSLIQSFRALTTSPLNRVSPMEEDPREPGPSVNKLYFPASVFFGKIRALPGPEEVEYPPRDLADKLVDAYFSRFHFLMPVIDKPSFMRQYTAIMDNTHDISIARKETAFLSVVFAVFACAARLVDDPRLATGDNPDDGGMGMIYYERALILHYISHASIQVAHVQCFILMSSFLCSVNCLPQAWLLVGQAVRSAQDLGLHRSPRLLLIPPIEKETRRKIWWGVYALDRMLALALGRPLGIEDSDCDVEWPVDVDDEELPDYFAGASLSRKYPSLMAGSIALTSLYQIAGRILRQVYSIELCRDQVDPEKKAQLHQNVEVLDKELTTWCDDLPVVFKSEPVNEKQVSMGAVLCSHYYSVLTTLHRNFLPIKRDQPLGPKSTIRAVSSARSCVRLAPSIRNVVPPSHHLAFFIQNLFSSAVVILLYAMHVTDLRMASAAMDEAKSCLVALESWVGYWPGAFKCKELLTDLTKTAMEAIQKAQANLEAHSSMPPPVSIERRHSITLATPSPPTASRTIKNKPNRRTRSRDANVTTRRVPVASTLSQRARSTSRKRGFDESETAEEPSFMSYQNVFSSPNMARANVSPHSSPGSVNLPSPTTAMLDAQDSSPRPVAGPSFSYPTVPLSPLHGPAQRFDYDFPMTQHPLSPSSSSHWSGGGTNNNDRNGLDMYPNGSHNSPFSYSGSVFGSNQGGLDPGFIGYEEIGGGAFPELSTTPPTASFSTPGLPFRGLDFIRNYHQGGYSAGNEQDSLWQSFDPGAFGIDPEVPFTALGDIPESGDGHL